MRLTKAILLLTSSLLISNAPYAAPATTTSIQKLLEMNQSEQQFRALSQSLMPLIQQQAEKTVKERTRTATLNTQQRQVAQELSQYMASIYQRELSWSKLQPEFIRLYQNQFSEDEIQTLLRWYSSPEARTVLNKLPNLFAATEQLGAQKAMQSVNQPAVIQQMQRILSKLK